jgi:hypothetical protein
MAGSQDRGDIAGIPGVVLECKSAVKVEMAAWVDEAGKEAANDGADFGAVWIKRRGKISPAHGYVLMTGQSFVALLAAAQYITGPPSPDLGSATATDPPGGRP